MPAPGTYIKTREASPTQPNPADTGVAYMVGVVQKGMDTPQLVTSMTDFEAKVGLRVPESITMYDAAEAFFAQGGSRLYVVSVYGPAATAAFVNLNDATAALTLRAEALGVGEYGNDLNLIVQSNTQDPTIPAGSFRITVQTDAGAVLEKSTELVDKPAALLWAQTESKFIKLKDAGPSVADPTTGTFALAGGVLDANAITAAQRLAALGRITTDYGTGMVLIPGATDDTSHDQLATHAETFNRVAIGDPPDTDVVATLTASAAGRRSRFLALFAPWLYVPGLTSGSLRKVPPSAVVAGKVAANEGAGLSPNAPAAGDNGQLRYVTSLTQRRWTETERDTLNLGGVNVIRDFGNGDFQIYGWRTTVNPATDKRWVNFGNSRLHRAVSARAEIIGKRYNFKEITPALVKDWEAALATGACLPYFLVGSLYGNTPAEAFRVDTASVNDPTTAEARQLNAVIVLVMSQFGEVVQVEIVKQLATEGVAA